MRLRTIVLIGILVLGLLAEPLPAEAQQTGKVYRIGFLDFRSRSTTSDPRLGAFREGLRKVGHVEGQNLVFEYRSAEGKRERLPDVAAELVRLRVDVIVTSPQPFVIRAMQRATRTIPIVLPEIHIDPVEAGFVDSLARPGGNITGTTNLDWKLHPKRLELFNQAFPRISRAAILWPQPQQKQGMKELEAVGLALGIQIQSVVPATRYVTPLDRLKSAFSAINRGRPEALLVASSGFARRHRKRILDFAVKSRLPSMHSSGGWVRAGGLMGYGASMAHLYRRAATYVDKILKGRKPADLPVEQPTKYTLVINLKTAKQLGITISPEVLYQATKVIK